MRDDLGPKGRPVTVACSDPEAARVDEVQYELDDGPCLHAMRNGRLVVWQVCSEVDLSYGPDEMTVRLSIRTR